MGGVAECEGGADLGGEVAMGQVCRGYEGGREESVVVPGKISMGTVVRGKAPAGVSLQVVGEELGEGGWQWAADGIR